MIFTFKFSNTLYKTLVLILCIGFSKMLYGQTVIQPGLNDLTFFKKSSKTWQIVGSVQADLNKANTLYFTKGSGVLLNLPDKKQKGEDLYSIEDYGDVDLELEFLMASESNSGIYLQGRYEIQLIDTWGATAIRSGSNGGIYERWNDSKPDGQKGYMGYAPRQNASRAPGLWQKLKISFQAPRFDANGNKTANAVMLKVELNGVLIHDNVELSGPTRGAISDGEAAAGPLRIQGDHGAVAFRNIKISKFDNGRPAEAAQANVNTVDPIHIEPAENYILRSFMDLPGSPRVVHAVSVGSPEKVHYTYDMDNAAIIQVWRGGFLNATPMWHDRGDGSSRPLGMVQRFGKPVQTLSRLTSGQSAWSTDTAGTGYRPKGYVLDANGRPTFKYSIYGFTVSDAVNLLEKGQGINRQISLSDSPSGIYFRLAEAASITEVSQGLYLVDDQSYFLRLDITNGAKAIIRDQNGRKELIIPAVQSLSYSILF
jgi:hypothetical protein